MPGIIVSTHLPRGESKTRCCPFFEEVLQLPFPLPEEAPTENGHQIIKTVADYIRFKMVSMEQTKFDLDDEYLNQQRKVAKQQLKESAAPLIDEYFGIIDTERIPY